MLLYLIRHGDPIYSPEEQLTKKGLVQADALADRLAVHGLTKIFSSPLRRARQTAEPTAKRLGLDVTILPWCSEALTWEEFTQKDAEGRSHWIMSRQNTDFRTGENYFRSNRTWSKCEYIQDVAKPFRESYPRIIEGGDAFLASLGYPRDGSIYRVEKANDDRVALFCHAGFLLVWVPFLLAIPPHLFWGAFSLTHTGISIFEFANNPDGKTAPRCLVWSDTSHLFKAGLELSYNNQLDF